MVKPAAFLLAAVALLAPLQGRTQEASGCATTIAQLQLLAGDPGFALAWEERSMEDGKPLRVTISEKAGTLSLEFVKHGEGLWAEGTGRLCRSGGTLEAVFGAGELRLGPAAHWALRMGLSRGGQFRLTRLDAGRLRIATAGWSGIFVPHPGSGAGR